MVNGEYEVVGGFGISNVSLLENELISGIL